jgi:transcriptional regulator with XRE-family HTH domain
MRQRGFACEPRVLGNLRRRKGWDVDDLALRSDVSVPTIMRAERGLKIDAATIRSLARALGVEPEQLLRVQADDGLVDPAACDYRRWQESDDTYMNSSCDSLRTVSFNEGRHLWGVAELYVPYEARLMKLCEAGRKIMRVFAVGRDLADEHDRMVLLRAMLRHRLLGFELRIVAKRDLDATMQAHVGRAWDCVGWQADKPALLVRFCAGAKQVSHADSDDVRNKLLQAHRTLWERGRTFETWQRRMQLTGLKELEQEVKRFQLEAIRCELT